jgi:hypothetical protein
VIDGAAVVVGAAVEAVGAFGAEEVVVGAAGGVVDETGGSVVLVPSTVAVV